MCSISVLCDGQGGGQFSMPLYGHTRPNKLGVGWAPAREVLHAMCGEGKQADAQSSKWYAPFHGSRGRMGW